MRPGKTEKAGDPIEVADRLHSAAIHLLRRVRAKDVEMGIGPAQASALSVLVFAGPRSLGELADAEQVKPPTMSRIVNGLIRAGMVKSETSAEDKRRLVLRATERGVKTMYEGRRRRVAMLAQAVNALPQNQRRSLRAAAGLMEQLSREIK